MKDFEPLTIFKLENLVGKKIGWTAEGYWANGDSYGIDIIVSEETPL